MDARNVGCPAAHEIAQEEIRIAVDERLGQSAGLRQEGPVELGDGRGAVHRFPGFDGGQDIEQRQARDRCRPVERHAIGDARTPIVADNGIVLITQGFHQRRHDCRCLALGILAIAGIGLDVAAVAVARQIGHDEAEGARKRRGQSMPAGMGLGITVKQKYGRSLAAEAAIDLDARGGDAASLEAGE